MPDISLLNPMVLRGVVEKFTAPENLILLNRVPKTPHPFPSATWDVISGSRQVADFNVPNSEAHVVDRLGRGQMTANFGYIREKKVFAPTTLYWLRTPGKIAETNAKAAVLREVADLNQRFDLLAEYCLFQSLTGELEISQDDVVANVDYGFADTHKNAQAATSWASATPAQIVEDIRVWKRLIARDGRVDAQEAYGTEKLFAYIFDSFATTGVAATFSGGMLLSDRMKEQYYTTGTLPGFMGLNWTRCEHVYTDDTGADNTFIDDSHLILGNFNSGRPIELFEGPTADLDAPENYTGKFAKTWIEKDPAARQYLLEWNMLPVITRPEQFVYANCVF